LGLVLGGECDWRVGPRKRRFSLRAGQALLVKPRTFHCEEIRADEEARLAWLGFDFAGPAPSWSHRIVTLGDDLAEIACHFDAISRDHHLTDERSRLRVELALQSVMLLVDRRAEISRETAPQAEASSLNPRQVRLVESAAHYFRHNLRHPLSIAQVAAYHALCPAHFSSLFRRHHRLTPRSFLREARLQRSAELLADSDLTMKEIAAECGFVDPAHFCKMFKQSRRTTPKVYRQRLRSQ
jgi:AraC-like DNA-binding protein